LAIGFGDFARSIAKAANGQPFMATL